MNILITTTVPGSAIDLNGIPQSLQNLEIGLYQRSSGDVGAHEFQFFSTSASGGATWDGQHLRINFERQPEHPDVHVDLAWSEGSRVWTGTFQRAAFRRKAITLRRPTGGPSSLLTGTWFDETRPGNNCLHIAEAQDGIFTAWADDIQVPGRMRYANGLRPPAQATEHYGEIAKVKVKQPDRIEVELRAYTPLCCSLPFMATLSPDGDSLLGEWIAAPNQAPRPARWTRVEGDSCLSANYFR